jgi:two-component system, sensor histidine kinase
MERRIDRALDLDDGSGGRPSETEYDLAARTARVAGAVDVRESDSGAGPPAPGDRPVWVTCGAIDRPSLGAAVLGGAGFLALACLSLLLARSGETVSPIWLPNACAAAFLLRQRIGNEWPFLIAAFAASLSANALAQLPWPVALVFSLANVVEVVIVVGLTRRRAGWHPDMRRLQHLAHFVWAGGLVGPLVSGLICIPVMGTTFAEVHAGTTTRFLTDSMAMVLIVPTALLMIDWVGGRRARRQTGLSAEGLGLMVSGMTCAFVVFQQAHYPLLFLIQPITLLHAFRLGSLGTALQVCGVTVVAGAMTWSGLGPIAAASGNGIAQLHLLQAFIAANFLTGLPVAAILAGRDRMMARLEAGKRQVDLLAENITDAVIRFDLDGVCTYASPSVRDVMGAPPEVYLGQPISARLHPDARDRAMQALGRLLDGTSDKERVTYRRFGDSPDGSPVFLEADCAVVRNPETGAREGVVVAARDVTERVELELLLTRARRHAENAARAKSEFLANMSHEIRTPMNGVLGFAELMLQGDLAADQRRFAAMIVQSGRSMMMLLNDVLDLSKIESGQFAIDRAPVDLHATLAECAALHRIAAEKKGLCFEFTDDDAQVAAPERRPWILTDGLRLRQIMLNLIGNAVKFTEAGHIRITYAINAAEVRVTVADSGIGISPARQETIFHPFTQGADDTNRQFGGTGLGLSISRQLASLLGGRVEVESTPGVGSRFTLVLPAALAPPEQAEPLPDPVLPADLPKASRILLAEDHDINRMLVTEMLERCGQEVDLAHDGNEAITMVIDSIMRGRPYDLVLMDVQMPDCDGYAATRAIRDEGIGPGALPIVALTANAFPEDVAAARAAGMQAHLAKPVVLADLARALQRWLPTRIVEAGRLDAVAAAPRRASALALSPRLVKRWRARRHEAIEAVRARLGDPGPGADGIADASNAVDSTQDLIRLLHKLAGTAAMFGEPELGACAASLERALLRADDAEESRVLARELLALADSPVGAQARKAASARG